MKNRVTLINVISSALLQLFTALSGFIIPRIILLYFGSDVNGLIASTTQFLSYISLVEGGISSVILANLYKPLVDNDDKRISAVVVTAGRFYRKIGFIFILYSVALSLIYPIVFETGFSFSYVCTLALILSLSTTIQYMFSINLRMLLTADKKVYVISFSQMLIVLINVVLVWVSVLVYPDIHVLKLITALVYSLQPIFYNWYVKKHYRINWTEKEDNNLIKERWNGFAINTAAFIHNCTDIAILTIFTDLMTVSIYSVYSLATNGIKQIVSSLSNGLNPTLGQAYAKGNQEELNQKIDLYEYIIFVLVSFLYTMTLLLITPFVMIYTAGIVDADYNQPLFGMLLVISEAVYIVKFPHLNLAYTANRFKDITVPAFVEAGINIILSLLLVSKLGLIGVAIGTIVAMIYRMVFHVEYTQVLVSSRKRNIFYKKLIVFAVTSAIGFGFGKFIFPISIYTVESWLIHAVVYGIVLLTLIIIVSVLFFRNELQFFVKYLGRKK